MHVYNHDVFVRSRPPSRPTISTQASCTAFSELAPHLEQSAAQALALRSRPAQNTPAKSPSPKLDDDFICISTLFKTLVRTYHILLFCQKTGRILKWICWSNRWWFWTCHVCNHRPSACKRLLSPAAFDPSDLKLRIASEGFFTPRIGFDLIDGKLASQPRTHM